MSNHDQGMEGERSPIPDAVRKVYFDDRGEPYYTEWQLIATPVQGAKQSGRACGCEAARRFLAEIASRPGGRTEVLVVTYQEDTEASAAAAAVESEGRKAA